MEASRMRPLAPDQLAVAMFVREFPVVSETFILRQITGLLDFGHEVDVCAEWRNPVECVHEEVEAYGLDQRTRYVDSPPASGYWEMPVRPLRGETWLPGAETPIRNLKRVAQAAPALARCLAHSPRQTMTVLSRAEYGYRAESLSSLYRLAAVSRLRRRYDVLHAHYGPVADNFRFARGALRAPLVVSFHGYDFHSWPRSEGMAVYDRLFATADVVTANSDYSRSVIAELGCPAEKLVRLPCAVDLDKFRYSERPRLNGEPLRVLTVARLVEKKGVEDSIRAIADLRDRGMHVEYDVIGDGPLDRELRGLVHDLRAERFVSFHGARDAAFVADSMARAHVFMLSGRVAADGDRETQGVALLEAQASGMPVVATRVGGIPESVADGHSGFLVGERDVSALADRVAYLVERPDACAEMGRSGRALMEAHYGSLALNRQLVEVYTEARERFRAGERA